LPPLSFPAVVYCCNIISAFYLDRALLLSPTHTRPVTSWLVSQLRIFSRDFKVAAFNNAKEMSKCQSSTSFTSTAGAGFLYREICFPRILALSDLSTQCSKFDWEATDCGESWFSWKSLAITVICSVVISTDCLQQLTVILIWLRYCNVQ